MEAAAQIESGIMAAGEHFDACAWLNAEIAERLARSASASDGGAGAGANGGSDVAVDADILDFLGELEVKLQLKADDLDASVEEVARAAHERLPLARQELGTLQEKAGALRKQILQMVEGIGKTQSTVGYTLGNIQVMDRVQSNMRRARDALGEAAGMAQLLATVEQTFKQGDLTTIGRQLKQIREGLESVSGVPEFAGVETKLHEFEERLQQMVQAPLQKAFEDHDAKSVQHLSSILVLSNKNDTIGTLFVSAKISKLQSSWETFSPMQGLGVGKNASAGDDATPKVVSFEGWLPEWLRSVLAVVEAEHKWCLEVLPGEADALFMTLIETCFISIKQSFKNRLQNTLSAAKLAHDAGDSPVSPLQVLVAVKTCLKDFLGSVITMLGRSGAREQGRGKLLECLALCTYGQIKDQVLLYPLLERQEISGSYNKLSGDLQLRTTKLKQAAHSSSGSVADSIEACTSAIHGLIGPLCKVGEAAAQRCLKITDGFKVDELLAVVDECLVAVMSKVSFSLKVIQDCAKEAAVKASAAGQDADAAYKQDGLPEDILVAILRVLQVAALFSASIGGLEEALGASVASLGSKSWELQSDIGVWFTLFPGQREEHVGKLAGFAGSPLLPSSQRSVKDFAEAAEGLVLDFMMIKVRESLLGLKESKLWCRAEGKDTTFDLPSFSVFPSKHVTSLGEYLLVVPQQFEVLDDLEEVGSRLQSEEEQRGEGSEQSSFAAEWISKIVEEAAKLYTRDILKIPRLNETGCSQLQADIDYLCNILQALFVTVPPALSTVASNLSLSNEEIKDPEKRNKDCDNAAWDRMVKMRGAAEKGAAKE